MVLVCGFLKNMYILPLEKDPTSDYEGIKRINALEWLMGGG